MTTTARLLSVRSSSKARFRILAIDDDPAIGTLLESWISSSPNTYAVSLCSDSSAAQTLLQAPSWDLVISDIDMPGLNGLDLLNSSKSAFPDRPVILMTSHELTEYAIHALRGGADDYLVKPLRSSHLLESISKVLYQNSKAREARRNVVLAIGAHPDDVEIGVGGLLFRHREQHDSLNILTLTAGEDAGAAETRLAEARSAAHLLDAHLYLGNPPETCVPQGNEAIQLISAAIEEVQPSIIYTHSLNDGHPDHRAVFHATSVAARRVANVYCYLSPSGTVDFRPTMFSDVGRHLQNKVELIRSYASQTSTAPYLDPELILATARYWGRFADYQGVEPLEVLREAR